ncbi:transcriptional regulator [Burkholderia plantarii]|uniref:transcriptional regulator n=1 Tax=Burkholderia plantarii TaxID=41899 RepID=UPI0018DE5F5A|nr:transcriptional regulator [Burkholderia plantarii]MBI0327669.1 transcriptional regulator [Burkholderia plantarii]
MSRRKSRPLVLDALLVTGNTKAAIAHAGGKSGDLWKVPPLEINYDPRDNARPLDSQRVRHLADLIKANGFDRKSPLGCYVRKVGGEDRIFVYAGQHRYHGARLAMEEGAKIEFLPCVIDEAKNVNRANLIFDGINANDSEKLTPLELAQNVVELQQLGVDNATICKRLDVTDQTIRDLLLLAGAPAALHKLIREKAVSSTLAIEEIRAHGGDDALERIVAGLSKAKQAGKGKVTRKHLKLKPAGQARTPTAAKINDKRAKQLLQALQSVLHDPGFGQLSPGTIHGVHTALTGFEDLLDALPRKATPRLHVPNEHGVFEDCEKLLAPKATSSGLIPAGIFVAHPEEGAWIYSFAMHIPPTYGFADQFPTARDTPAILPTRVQAIRAAVSDLTRLMQHGDRAKSKYAASVNAWLDKLYALPDPEWTPELTAKHTADQEAA